MSFSPLRLLVFWFALLFSAPVHAQVTPVPQEAINSAVDRGVIWLRGQQRRDGSWGENDMTPGGHRDPRNDLTAFCAYTLLKCKVPYEDPAIQRALTFLDTAWPSTTYSYANQILLLSICEDSKHEPRLKELVEGMLELRHKSHGIWGYPGHPSIQTDLSNTQYAVLALRAASARGIRIPKDVWVEIAERILIHQEKPKFSDFEKRGRKKLQMAGFAYLLPNPSKESFGYNVPNASMTTAGLVILRIVQDQLGSKLPGRLKRQATTAIDHGFRWMREYYSVTNNVAGQQAWLYYYLYGLQRLGALFELDKFGDHDWYWDGAAELIKWQGKDGHWEKGAYQQWPRQPMPHANTGYALLFLVKAMAPVSGASAESRGKYASEKSGTEVHLRAAVRKRASVWVSGFGKDVVASNTVDSPDASGMFVNQVRFYVDGEMVQQIDGDPDRPWNGERFSAILDLKHNAEYKVRVGVVVRSAEAKGGEVELTSDTLTITVRGVLENWMLGFADIASKNKLRGTMVSASASSSKGKWTTADRAHDGMQASRWLSAATDDKPTLLLKLDKAAWADALVLSQSDSHFAELGRHDRVTRVAVRINGGKRAIEVDMEESVMRPTRIPLAKRVRVNEIEIEILASERGSEAPGCVGFAEVALTDR
jgi:hypothetical protein